MQHNSHDEPRPSYLNYCLVFIFSSQFLALSKAFVDVGGLLFSFRQLADDGSGLFNQTSLSNDKSNETHFSHDNQGAAQLHDFLGGTGSRILTDITESRVLIVLSCVARIHWEFFLRNVLNSGSHDPFAPMRKCIHQLKLICHCEKPLLSFGIFTFMLGVFTGNILFCINLTGNLCASILLACLPMISSLFFRVNRLFFITISKSYLQDTFNQDTFNSERSHPSEIQEYLDSLPDSAKVIGLINEVLRGHEVNAQGEPSLAVSQKKNICFDLCQNTLYPAFFFIGKFLEVYTPQIFSAWSICQSLKITDCSIVSPWSLPVIIVSAVLVTLNSHVALRTKVGFAEMKDKTRSRQITKQWRKYNPSDPNSHPPGQDIEHQGEPNPPITNESQPASHTLIIWTSVSLNTATIILQAAFNLTTPLGTIAHYFKDITPKFRSIYMLVALLPMLAYVYGTIDADIYSNEYYKKGALAVFQGLSDLIRMACGYAKPEVSNDSLKNLLLSQDAQGDQDPQPTRPTRFPKP